MNIVVGPPPNHQIILDTFKLHGRRGILFCYGGTIYDPHGVGVHPSKVPHEKVHSERQRAAGVEAWWDRYLVDVTFRFDEELPAHVAEYAWFEGLPRNQRRIHLRNIARNLAGPLYGHMLTVHEAKRLISRADADV